MNFKHSINVKIRDSKQRTKLIKRAEEIGYKAKYKGCIRDDNKYIVFYGAEELYGGNSTPNPYCGYDSVSTRTININLDEHIELFEAVLGIISIREDGEIGLNYIVRTDRFYTEPNIYKVLEIGVNPGNYYRLHQVGFPENGGFDSKDYVKSRFRLASPEEIIAHFSKQNKIEKMEELTFDENNWYIKITKENKQVVINYFKSKTSKEWKYSIGYIYGKVNGQVDSACREGKELTFEQFNKYIINSEKMKEKEIKSYKLINPNYEKAAARLLAPSLNSLYGNVGNPGDIEKLRSAGVLDIWFEPIYEKEKKILPSINGYEGHLERGVTIVYGSNCAKFDRTFFEKLNKVNEGGINRKIQSIKLDSGVEITMQQVREICEFLDENK